jgi:hypothetical protein
VPLSLPSRLGRSAALTCSARSSSAARCFSTLSPSDPRLFTGEFVRRSFLVRRASTFRRDRALCLWVHRCKSAGCLADVARATKFSSTVIAPAHPTACTPDYAASASLIHSFLLVVPLVCHYRSPAANIRVQWYRRWTCKRQAVISGEGRNPASRPHCGFLPFSHVCERLC